MLVSNQVEEKSLNMRNKSGFTLFEVLTALLISTMIMKYAVVAYADYVVNMKRDVAKSCVVDLSFTLERYYVNNSATYVGYTLPTSECIDKVSNAYTFSTPTLTEDSFRIEAAAIGGQATSDDPACISLTLDNLNTKTPRSCW